MYIVFFDIKKWVEESEGRWEEGGERWGGMERGRKNENDLKIIKGLFLFIFMLINECIKKNIKYY